MAVKEGYDVLRLIEHGQTCYISSEYVRGRPLAWYIKEHPRIPKKLLLEWILHLERQLEMLHKCGQKSATIAVEAGSERLRKVINKHLNKEDILCIR